MSPVRDDSPRQAVDAVLCPKSVDCCPLTVVFLWAFRLRLQLRRRAFRYIFARSARKGCRSNP